MGRDGSFPVSPRDRKSYAYGPSPIGMLIKWIRTKNRHWSRRELAMRSGIARHTIIRVEDGGVQTPRWSTIAGILRGLGVPLDDARRMEEQLIQALDEKRQIVWVHGIPRTIREDLVDLYWEAREKAGSKWREYLRAEVAKREAEEAGREQQDGSAGRAGRTDAGRAGRAEQGLREAGQHPAQVEDR